MRVRSDINEPQRPWIGDQFAQYPSPARQRPDLPACRVIHPRGDKPFKFSLGAVKDAYRRITGPGQLTPRLEHPPEHHVNVQVGEHPARYIQQPKHARGYASLALSHARHHALRRRQPA